MEKFVAILLFICSVCAAQETNWEKLKEENSPLTTSCIDLTKMNKKETRLSLVLFDNLKKYLSSNELTKDEKQKGIQLDLKAIGLQKKNIVIIFQKESALMAEPGNALRKENRMILEKKLEKWKASQKIKEKWQKNIYMNRGSFLLCGALSIAMAFYFQGDIKSAWKTMGSYEASCLLLPMLFAFCFPGRFRDQDFIISSLFGVVATTYWRYAEHIGFWQEVDALYIGMLATSFAITSSYFFRERKLFFQK